MAETPKKTTRARKPAAKAAPKAASEPTAKQRAQIIAEHLAQQDEQKKVKRYVRNMSGAPFRMKLDRHAPGQRGIQLKPRGERGDISPIEELDLQDPILNDNVNLGLVEVINGGEAAIAMSKQSINQQNVHPALAALKNEKGEGDMKLTVDKSMEEQGIVVAELEDGQVAFERGKKGAEIKRPQRQPGESPGVPDNIPGAEPGPGPANEQASFLSDLRSKTTVNPPQKG